MGRRIEQGCQASEWTAFQYRARLAEDIEGLDQTVTHLIGAGINLVNECCRRSRRFLSLPALGVELRGKEQQEQRSKYEVFHFTTIPRPPCTAYPDSFLGRLGIA